jgi:hypothetical protein
LVERFKVTKAQSCKGFFKEGSKVQSGKGTKFLCVDVSLKLFFDLDIGIAF